METTCKITNIVAKTKTDRLVELDELYLLLELNGHKSKYNNRFPAVFVRMNNGSCTIFSTGTVTLNGIRKFSQIPLLIDELQQTMTETGIRLRTDYNVVNIVATFETGIKIDISKLGTLANSYYNPDDFNSVKVHLGGRCCALVHHTGNGIVTGSTSIAQLTQGWKDLLECLHKNCLNTSGDCNP